MGTPDIAHSTPKYRVSLTLDENVIKVEKQKVEIKFTKDEKILTGVYNVPKITPSKTPKRLPNNNRVRVRSNRSSGYSNNDIVGYGKRLNAQIFGESEWQSLYLLWQKESGWSPTIVNRSSGAAGICQNINGWSKGYSYGDYKEQIQWGISYIKNRFGIPSVAWRHSQIYNWY